MADYNTAATGAADSLTGDLVEEYEISENRRRVKRGKSLDQIDAAAKLEGLAARRAGSKMFTLAKFKRPQT